MIDHSFSFLLKEYEVNFNEEFKNFIINYPVDKFEFNDNSFYNTDSNDRLKNETNNYLKNIFDEHSLYLDYVWVQKYDLKKFHDLHIHGWGDIFSFVWYINCTDKSSKTVFFNPGYPYLRTHQLEITPKSGKLILFNGCLPHYVLPNDDNKRIVISGNLKLWQK